jgi:DNA-binding transcriptional LysR family regulator
VELSDAGKLLLAEARRTLEQAERTKQLIQRSARGETGVVRIGFVGNAVAAGRLSNDLQAFHAAWPQVGLELRELAPAAQQEAVLAGYLDIGYCPMPGITLSQNLSVRQVGSWSWEVVMSRRHRLAGKRALAAPDLLEESFINYAADGDDEGQVSMLRRVLGREPRIAHKVNSTLAVLAFAAAGLGLALVPAPLKRIATPNVVYRKLADRTLASRLVMISRIAGEWGAVQRYLEMTGS